VVVADNRTKQWAFDFKVNGTVRTLAWSPDSRYLLASGGDSQVYTWDLRASRCRACWNNDGGTPTSSMAVSPPMATSGLVGAGGGKEAFTAIGAESGVVNLYSYGAGTAGPDSVRPSPRRAIMSLTTPVETLKFNPDGQILAMVSFTYFSRLGSHHSTTPHHVIHYRHYHTRTNPGI
jgi:U3 small nucleolar RNA-associated protein 18